MSKHEIGCLNHCRGGSHGSGGKLLGGMAVVVLLILIGITWKARRGVETGLHTVAVIGEVIMWAVAAALILGVAAGFAWVAWKIWRRVQAARKARPAALPAPPRIIEISNRAPEAIEPARTEQAGWIPSSTDNWVPPARQEANDDARPYSRFR